MRKLLTELIGTFILVFTVGMTVLNPGAGSFAPLAIGSALMIMVYAGGHVSGGHYNPAVTLGVWIRGAMPGKDVAGYIVVQLIGAFLASWLVMYFKSGTFGINPSMNIDIIPALIAEIIGTFALVYVVLNTATARATSGNSNYGLAIGFTVVVMAYALGGISGGAFNPAIAAGICAMKMVGWASFWVYLVANLLGGALAAYAFKYINPDDK